MSPVIFLVSMAPPWPLTAPPFRPAMSTAPCRLAFMNPPPIDSPRCAPTFLYQLREWTSRRCQPPPPQPTTHKGERGREGGEMLLERRTKKPSEYAALIFASWKGGVVGTPHQRSRQRPRCGGPAGHRGGTSRCFQLASIYKAQFVPGKTNKFDCSFVKSATVSSNNHKSFIAWFHPSCCRDGVPLRQLAICAEMESMEVKNDHPCYCSFWLREEI